MRSSEQGLRMFARHCRTHRAPLPCCSLVSINATSSTRLGIWPAPKRHHVRRTGATMLSNMGIEPHITEASFHHISIHSQPAAPTTLFAMACWLPTHCEV